MRKTLHHLAILTITFGVSTASAQIYDPRTWTNIRVTRLPDEVQSYQMEYACTFTPTGDTLYFTSKRKGGTDQLWLVEYRGGEYYNVKRVAYPSNHPTGAVTIDAKGVTYLAMQNPKAPQGNTRDVNIYRSEASGLVGLPATINTSDWESQPFINPAGDTLYFSSVKSGGSDVDIYRSTTYIGPWDHAVSVGSGVNTGAYEGFPTLSRDSKHLFFTRMYRGKYALFYSTWMDSSWSEARPVPAPINTGKEKSIVFHPTERLFIIASGRESLSDKNYDLYEVRYDIKE